MKFGTESSNIERELRQHARAVECRLCWASVNGIFPLLCSALQGVPSARRAPVLDRLNVLLQHLAQLPSRFCQIPACQSRIGQTNSQSQSTQPSCTSKWDTLYCSRCLSVVLCPSHTWPRIVFLPADLCYCLMVFRGDLPPNGQGRVFSLVTLAVTVGPTV